MANPKKATPESKESKESKLDRTKNQLVNQIAQEERRIKAAKDEVQLKAAQDQKKLFEDELAKLSSNNG